MTQTDLTVGDEVVSFQMTDNVVLDQFKEVEKLK